MTGTMQAQRLIDWCLPPTLAVFQLNRVVNKCYIYILFLSIQK
jgi:hypothetical protein